MVLQNNISTCWRQGRNTNMKGNTKKSLVLGIILLMVGANVLQNIDKTVKADPTEGLVGYWNFDEGSGTTAHDTSGIGLNGAILGATWTTGVSGSALLFDGVNDCVDLPDNNFKFQTFSISCWASCDTFGYFPPIFSVNNQAAYGGWLLEEGVRYSGNTLNFMTLTGAGTEIDIVKSQPIVTSHWYHIVGVKTPSSIRIYIDGVLKAEDTTVSPVVYTGCAYGDDFLPFIGCTLNVHIIDRYFDGKIDDVRVYNRALEATEVTELYQQHTSVANLVGYWNFDEGNNNIAHDSSIAENDGTISGPTWTTGISNTALHFDGSYDKVAIPHDSTLSINGPFTIGAWVKRESSGFGSLQYIVSKDISSGTYPYSNYNLLIETSNKIALYLKGLNFGTPTKGTKHVDAGGGGIIGVTPIVDENWHYITGVYTGTQLLVYLDGEPDGAVPTTGTPYTNTNEVWIGMRKHIGSPDGFFKGIIDELQIYNRALDESEIQYLYNYPKFKNQCLTVSDNKIINGNGEEIILRGVSFADPYMMDQDQVYQHSINDILNDIQRLKNDWNINIIRIPAHPKYWKNNLDSKITQYLTPIINKCSDLGIYVLIDWHAIGNPTVDGNHDGIPEGEICKGDNPSDPIYDPNPQYAKIFWARIVDEYGTNPYVLYEIFNEPSDGIITSLSWLQWKSVAEDIINTITDHTQNNNEKIIFVAGIDYASDLSNVKGNYIENMFGQERSNIVYVCHPYPSHLKSWYTDFGYLKELRPVFASEWGFYYDKSAPFLYGTNDSYGEPLVNIFNSLSIGWTAWCFHPVWGPNLLNDFSYINGQFSLSNYGSFVKEILTGERTIEHPLPVTSISVEGGDLNFWTIHITLKNFGENSAYNPSSKNGVHLQVTGSYIGETYISNVDQGGFNSYITLKIKNSILPDVVELYIDHIDKNEEVTATVTIFGSPITNAIVNYRGWIIDIDDTIINPMNSGIYEWGQKSYSEIQEMIKKLSENHINKIYYGIFGPSGPGTGYMFCEDVGDIWVNNNKPDFVNWNNINLENLIYEAKTAGIEVYAVINCFGPLTEGSFPPYDWIDPNNANHQQLLKDVCLYLLKNFDGLAGIQLDYVRFKNLDFPALLHGGSSVITNFVRDISYIVRNDYKKSLSAAIFPASNVLEYAVIVELQGQDYVSLAPYLDFSAPMAYHFVDDLNNNLHLPPGDGIPDHPTSWVGEVTDFSIQMHHLTNSECVVTPTIQGLVFYGENEYPQLLQLWDSYIEVKNAAKSAWDNVAGGVNLFSYHGIMDSYYDQNSQITYDFTPAWEAFDELRTENYISRYPDGDSKLDFTRDDYHYNRQQWNDGFSIIDYDKCSQSINSKITITLHSPADLHIYDNQGRHTGFNYTTGEVDLNVIYSTYSGIGTEPQIIELINPDLEQYKIKLIGTENGEFSLDIKGYQGEMLVYLKTFSGIISPSQEIILYDSFKPEVDNAPPRTDLAIDGLKFNSFVSSSTFFNLSIFDAGIGVAKIFYKINDVIYEGEYNSPQFFSLPSEGEYNVEYWSVDLFGNGEKHNKNTYLVDNTPPFTIINVSIPKFGDMDRWVISSTTFNLTANDNIDGSGLNSIKYRIWCNGVWTSWDEYTGNFTLAGEGKHYLEYYSIDNVGNVEETHNQTRFVDDTPPVTTKSLGIPTFGVNNLWISSETPFNLTADDVADGSGVQKIYYRLWQDSTWTSWMTYSNNFTLPEEGLHYLEYYSIDNLGNIEQTKNQTHIVDDTTPTTVKTIGNPKYGIDDEWVTSSTSFNLSTSDNLSGVDSTYYRIWYNNRWTEWIDYEINFTLSGEGTHYLEFYSVDNLGNMEIISNQTYYIDDTPPIIIKTLSTPTYGTNNYWITSTTSCNFTADDTINGVGIDKIKYRVWYNNIWTAWMTYIQNFTLSGQGLHYLEYYSVDNLGNVEEIYNQTHYVDDIAPSIAVVTPSLWEALQDGVTFSSTVTDSCGVDWVKYAIREPGGGQGTIIDPMYESLIASSASDNKWQLLFDTTQLDDGYYVLLVNASDNLGNIGYTTVNFSIRNWAVLENLPNTPNSKAGRTMPVKFSLRVAEAVDPAQPFVRNEELTIKIYIKGNPQNILQTSTYGSASTDYRISSTEEHYITNFHTLSTPKTYKVDIWRDTLLIGSFEFSTVK